MVGPTDHASPAADDPRATDEALRLIGLFFFNFSRYASHLEHGLSQCIGIGDPRVNRTMWAITGRMDAYPLREAFFAAAALVREPSEQEGIIRKKLNERGDKLTRKRNDFAHGGWYFSTTGVDVEGGDGQEVSPRPTLLRQGGKFNEEPGHRSVIESREELAIWAQEAEDVALLVWEYISGLFGPPGTPGVTDRLGFADGVLVRLDRSDWTPGDQA